MGNEQSKQSEQTGLGLRLAKATGATVLALAATPLVIIATFYLLPVAVAHDTPTGLGPVADVAVGVAARALTAPLMPVVFPIYAALQAFHEAPPRRKVSETVCKEARKKLNMDCENRYNIAVAGGSGQGKSSLINALMGIKDNDENAAKVGEVESTLDIKPYPHPVLKTVVLWDLPGGGTEEHPKETYFKDKMLFAFDALILVTASRFTQIDLDIAKQADEAEVPVFFVRNKADQDVDAKMRRYDGITWEKAATELQKEVHRSIQKQLEKAGLTLNKLFVVSAWYLQELVQLIIKEAEPSQELKLMDEFALITFLAKETVAHRSS